MSAVTLSRAPSRPPPVALGLTVAVLSVSLAAIFFRQASSTHPLLVSGGRLMLAAVLLAPLTLRAYRRGKLPAPVLRAGALGGVCYALHFSLFVSSLHYTTVAASVTLVTATPVILAVWALVRRTDQPTPRVWWALGLATLGVLLLVGGADLRASPEALFGDALAFGGAATIAVYFQVVRGLGASLDPLAFGGLCCGVAGVLLLSSAAVLGVPLELGQASDAVWIALAALIPQLLGHTLITWCLRHTTPTVVGLATVGEPVGSTALAWLVFAELPTLSTAIGCGVILAAVTLALRRTEVPVRSGAKSFTPGR